MRVAAYCRVSTEEQAEKFGLAAQLREIREYARRQGLPLAPEHEFADDGVSGATLERPALTRLRDMVKARGYDLVVVHDPDRLARKLALQLLLLDEFERHGARVEFVTTPNDASPEGTLLLQMRGVISEWERAKIRERTTRGAREKARQGQYGGGPVPFGYRRDPSAPGRLVVEDDAARVVRRIFASVVEDGRSIRGTAAELNRAGEFPPRARSWSAATLRTILNNPAYKGTAIFNRRQTVVSPKTGKMGSHRWRSTDDWISFAVPAIVAPDVFDAAARQLGRNRAILSGRPPKYQYLLRGLLKCERCHRRMVGNLQDGKPWYRCNGHDHLNANRCDGRSIPARWIEEWVWKVLVGILRNPAVLREKVEAHRTTIGVREVEVRSELEHVERQGREVERQQRRLLDLFLGDDVPAPAARQRLDELERQRTALRDRAERLRQQADHQRAEETRRDAIERYCKRVLRGIGKLTLEGRQRLLRALVDEIVLRNGELEIHGMLPGRWYADGSAVPETVSNGERLFPPAR